MSMRDNHAANQRLRRRAAQVIDYFHLVLGRFPFRRRLANVAMHGLGVKARLPQT
jgi:hypothetical protein